MFSSVSPPVPAIYAFTHAIQATDSITTRQSRRPCRWAVYGAPAFDEADMIFQALHDIVKAGYARYIGMSSCYAWQCEGVILMWRREDI